MTQQSTSQGPALAHALADRALGRGSGIVRATRGKLRRIFCVVDGQIAYATSNIVEEQFPDYLVRRGLLTPAMRASAEAEGARTGKKLAVVLQEALQRDDLRRAMQELIEYLLSSTLEWPDGTCELKVGTPNLEGEITVRMSPVLLLLSHARRYPIHLDAVRTRIGPPDVRPEKVEGRAVLLGERAGETVFSFLLERCDGTLAVPELVARAPATEEETLRGLHALLLLGIVVATRERMVFRETARLVPLGRDECLAILARAAADHYGVLGLPRGATVEDIRNAYYSLARRYHPDRFRAGKLQDLLPRMEQYFTTVTEAYNTLTTAELRMEYDRQLEAPAAAEPEAKQSESSHLARQNYLRGRALLDMRRYADATTFLENAVKLDSTQATYHLELGLLLARNPRRRKDAERELIRAAEIEPTNVASYLALGQIYQRGSRLAHASRMYREVLRWEPQHDEAKQLLKEVGAQEEVPESEYLRAVFGG